MKISLTAKILRYFAEAPRFSTPTRVAEDMGCSKATAKRHLKKLEALEAAFPTPKDEGVCGRNGWRTGCGRNGRYVEDGWQLNGEGFYGGKVPSLEDCQRVVNGEVKLWELDNFCF